MKKKLVKKNSSEDTMRGYAVIVESMDHKLDLVLENQTERFERVETALIQVLKDGERTRNDLELVKGDIDIIKGDIELIKTDLRHKVDLEDFEALEHRVSMLEKVRK